MVESDPNIKFVKEMAEFTWDRLTNNVRVQEMFPAAYAQDQDCYKNESVCYTIRSDKDSHFTGALAMNAFEDENLTGLASNKIRIKRVKLQSDQNLDWQLYFWKKDTFDDTDLDLDAFCGRITLTSTIGEQRAGANQYYYDSGIMDIPEEDLDGSFEQHISLVNRSAVAKIAGATGEVICEIEYEPCA